MTESIAPATGGVRCSDADRERTSERLRDAAGEGRLTIDELEERLTRVYAARYGHELEALVVDLPRAAVSGAAGWRTVLAMVWTQLTMDFALLLGRRGPGWSRRRFVVAAVAAVVLTGVILAAVNGFGGDGWEHHGLHEPGRGF